MPGEAEDRATRPQILTRVSEVSLEVVKISAEAILGPTSPEEAPPEAVPSEAETDHLARRLVVSLTLILMLKEPNFLTPCQAKAFYSLALIAFLFAFKIITLTNSFFSVDASRAFKNLDQTELLRAAMIPDTGHGARWNLQPLLSFFPI